MNKIMIVAGCLLGLALACIPAYASPTDKKYHAELQHYCGYRHHYRHRDGDRVRFRIV